MRGRGYDERRSEAARVHDAARVAEAEAEAAPRGPEEAQPPVGEQVEREVRGKPERHVRRERRAEEMGRRRKPRECEQGVREGPVRREPCRAAERDEAGKPERHRHKSRSRRAAHEGPARRGVGDERAREQRRGPGAREPLSPGVSRVADVQIRQDGTDRAPGGRDREAGEARRRPRREQRRRDAHREVRPSRHVPSVLLACARATLPYDNGGLAHAG